MKRTLIALAALLILATTVVPLLVGVELARRRPSSRESTRRSPARAS